jgi:hypothetical protein
VPYTLILEVGLMLIQLFVGDLNKRASITKRYIEFIESRSDQFKMPSRIRDQYNEAKRRLEENEKP